MQANKYNEKTVSSKVIHCLKQVAMHKETKEIFYLANGKDLLGTLIDLKMINLYPKANSYAETDSDLKRRLKTVVKMPEKERETQMYRIVKSKEMILMYNNGEENYDIEISAKDLLLPTF